MLSFESGFTGALLIPGEPWVASALALRTWATAGVLPPEALVWGQQSAFVCLCARGSPEALLSLCFPYPVAFVGLSCDPVTKCPGV